MFHPIQTDQTTNSQFSRVFSSKAFYAIGYENQWKHRILVSDFIIGSREQDKCPGKYQDDYPYDFFYFQVTKLNIKCLNEVDCVQHYPTSTVTDLLMNSEQLPEIRRRNSAKNGRTDHTGTNQILPAAAASSLESQSPQTSEGKNKPERGFGL